MRCRNGRHGVVAQFGFWLEPGRGGVRVLASARGGEPVEWVVPATYG